MHEDYLLDGDTQEEGGAPDSLDSGKKDDEEESYDTYESDSWNEE